MLKIKQQKWRRGVRLLLKAGFVAGVCFLLFGVWFGLSRGAGAEDGSLLVFCRVCRDFDAGDAMLMANGEVIEYGGDGDDGDGVVVGKVIAKLSVRGFKYEVSE